MKTRVMMKEKWKERRWEGAMVRRCGGGGAEVIGVVSIDENDLELSPSAAPRKAQQINESTKHAKHRYAKGLKHRSPRKYAKCFFCRIVQRTTPLISPRYTCPCCSGGVSAPIKYSMLEAGCFSPFPIY